MTLEVIFIEVKSTLLCYLVFRCFSLVFFSIIEYQVIYIKTHSQ